MEAPDLERLAVRLGAAGNYAFSVEGTTLLAAFEDDADAKRFADVLRPKQITRESGWASKALAQMDSATYRRITRILKKVRLTAKRQRLPRSTPIRAASDAVPTRAAPYSSRPAAVAE